MSTDGAEHVENGDSARRNILTISLAKHLTGEPISQVLEDQWSKTSSTNRAAFNNYGFNIDVADTDKTMASLRDELHQRQHDGVLLGWCVRGHQEFTELFEEIVNVCVDELYVKSKTGTKLFFCTGADDVVNATVRNFPV